MRLTLPIIAWSLFFVVFREFGVADVLVLEDPLIGSTSGTRVGGSFTQEGWRVDGQYDSIYWHLPYTIQKGAVEFYIRGIRPNECRPGMQDKTELFHMYDYTYANSDTNYAPGYRDNPYKHFIRKTGCLDTAKTDSFELLLKIEDEYTEPDSSVMTWDENSTYLIREEWEPDGHMSSTLGQAYMAPIISSIWLVSIATPGSVRFCQLTWQAGRATMERRVQHHSRCTATAWRTSTGPIPGLQTLRAGAIGT